MNFRNWITVGGIRSTGVTACLGIAKHVQDLVRNTLSPQTSVSGQSSAEHIVPFWVTTVGSVVMDGAEYNITHPIAKYGLTDAKSKL